MIEDVVGLKQTSGTMWQFWNAGHEVSDGSSDLQRLLELWLDAGEFALTQRYELLQFFDNVRCW